MEHILQKIMCVTIILLSAVYSVSAVGPETTTIYCQGGEIPGVPRRIVELSGTFTHQMEDAGSSKEVLSMQSCEDTQAFIELLERSIPPELQSDPHAKLLGDAEPVIQKNIVQNLTQKLSCNSLNLFHRVLSFVETGNYLDCPVVRHGAEEALVRYVTEADNVDYFVEHPQYYGAMMQALNEKPQEIHDEMRDVLMSSRTDLNTFYERYTVCDGFGIKSLAYSPDGKWLAAGLDAGTISIWSPESGNRVRTLVGHTHSVNSVAYSPDGRQLASGSNDRTIKIWDLKSGGIIRILDGHINGVHSVTYSPDSKYFASGGGDWTIKIWDLESVDPIKTLRDHTYSVNSVAYSPDGKYLASSSGDNTVKIWDLENGNSRTLRGHKNAVNSVAYSPDGKYLASGSSDNTVKIWDLENGNSRTGEHANGVMSVAYNPDGKYLAACSYDGTIKIWDLQRGRRLHAWKGHRNPLYSVVYSPNGKQLASGCNDNTIKIWQWQPKKFTGYFSLPQLMLYALLRNAAGKQIIAKGFIAHLVVNLDTIMHNADVRGNISAEEFQDYEDSLAQVQLCLSPEELKRYQLSPEPVYIRGT